MTRSSRMSLEKYLIEQLLAQQKSQHDDLLQRISSLESQVSHMSICGMASVFGWVPDLSAWQYFATPEDQGAGSEYIPSTKHEIGIQCGGYCSKHNRVFSEASVQTDDCEIDALMKHKASLGHGTQMHSRNPNSLPDSRVSAWVLLAKASLALQEIRRIEMWVRPNPVLLGSDGALPKVLQALSDAHDGGTSAIRPSWDDLKSAAKVCSFVSVMATSGPLLLGAAQAIKAASRTWRDLVVCHCFHHMSENGTDDKDAFLVCLDEAFEGKLHRETNLVSQLLQAYSRVPRIVYRASPHKKRRQKKKTPASHEEATIRKVDHQHTTESIHEVSELPPRSADGKRLLVRNTFIDVMSESGSSCKLAFARSCPGNFVTSIDDGMAKLSTSASVDADLQHLDCAMTVLMEMALDDEVDDADPQAHIHVLQQCAECRSEDPSGWEDPNGRFYCLRCWEWWRTATVDSSSTSASHLDKAANTGLAEVYHQLDPMCGTPKCDCKVIVHEMDCFDVAPTINHTYLVLLGSSHFIEAASPSWTSVAPPLGILYRLFSKSTFQKDAVREDMMVPRKGGVYAPVVTIFKDSLNNSIPGFQTAVLYATCPWSAFEDEINGEARFRNEFRETILNALRVCYKHGHRNLLIGSGFSTLPKSTVAQLFREVLLEVGDTCNIFEQVTFAFCDDDVVSAFRNEFHEPSHASSLP